MAAMSKSATDDRETDSRTRWQRIEVRHLVALAAIAHEGSFRRAADELGYVQSAISGQIAHLEQAVGVRLLERASGTPVVELTPAGDVLLRHTHEILARFDTAYADVSSLGRRTAGSVRVAGLEHFAPGRLARILSLFRQRHPFARVILEEPPPDVAHALLEAGSLDVLICEDPPPLDSIETLSLEQDEFVLLIPSDSALAGRRLERISARQLADLDPIVPGVCARSPSLRLRLAELGIDPDGALAADTPSTAQALVAAGLGVAILPSGLVRADDPAVLTRDVSHILPAREVCAAIRAGRTQSVTVQSFIRDLLEVCNEDSGAGLRSPIEAASPDRRAA
jgi:DNA-binding transcriptional LysR family regulator